MTPHDRALELIALANADLYVARVLLPDSRAADSMIGFHLQQTVEKLLKALLAERNVDYPRTHSLLRLIHLAGEQSYAPPGFVHELVALNRLEQVRWTSKDCKFEPSLSILSSPTGLNHISGLFWHTTTPTPAPRNRQAEPGRPDSALSTQVCA